MIRTATIVTALAGLAASAQAQPMGRLDTVPLGRYECALPGSAAGAAYIAQDHRDFTIGNASSYSSSRGSGTYLATKTMVTFTRGPLKGQMYKRMGASSLRELKDDGSLGRLRCVRNNAR